VVIICNKCGHKWTASLTLPMLVDDFVSMLRSYNCPKCDAPHDELRLQA